MTADRGPCIGRFKKWTYDEDAHECKEFTFGGCEGNGNRFSSQQECEAVCIIKDEEGISLRSEEAVDVPAVFAFVVVPAATATAGDPPQ